MQGNPRIRRSRSVLNYAPGPVKNDERRPSEQNARNGNKMLVWQREKNAPFLFLVQAARFRQDARQFEFLKGRQDLLVRWLLDRDPRPERSS